MKSKRTVILLFTLLWCIVLVVRARYIAASNQQLDASWLMSLASTLDQGLVSGRDYHFTFGPLAQVIAAGATSLTASGNAFDAFPLIVSAFCLSSVLLIGLYLLLADEIEWRAALLVYLGCAFLNLFHDISGVRLVLLLIAAVAVYRSVVAYASSYGVAFAAMAGLFAFAAQAISLDIGIYAVVSGCGVFLFGLLLNKLQEGRDVKSKAIFVRLAAFLGVVVLGNLALTIFNFTTAADPVGLFDYHLYAFQMMRGYNAGMAAPWQLDLTPTVVLVAIALLTLVIAGFAIVRVNVQRSVFIFSLVLPAVLTVKSGLVRSDLGHISYAFTLLAFLLLVLCSLVFSWDTRRPGIAACVLILPLMAVWPWAGVSAATDLLMAIRGEVSLGRILSNIQSARSDPSVVLSPAFAQALSREPQRALLSFPYDNYVPVLVGRPLIAPVLQTHNAGTSSLQEYYVKKLREKLEPGFDVVFNSEAWAVDNVQNLTRVPKVFEFLYEQFQLLHGTLDDTGFVLLRLRTATRSAVYSPLPVNAKDTGPGEIVLARPTDCAIPRFDMQMAFSSLISVTKPVGLAMTFWLDNEEVATRYVTPIEINRPFTTFISLIDDFDFYRVFGNERIESHRWNRITYGPGPHDLITVLPHHVVLNSVDCMDQQRWYAEAIEGEFRTSNSRRTRSP